MSTRNVMTFHRSSSAHVQDFLLLLKFHYNKKSSSISTNNNIRYVNDLNLNKLLEKELKRKKKQALTGFEPVTFAMLVQMLCNLSYETTDSRSLSHL